MKPKSCMRGALLSVAVPCLTVALSSVTSAGAAANTSAVAFPTERVGVLRSGQIATPPESRANTNRPVGLHTSRPPASLYWVDRHDLTATRSQRLPAHCGGRYLLPPLPYPSDIDSSTLAVEGEADLVEYRVDGDITLEGDVVLSQGNRIIRAGRAILDQGSRRGRLEEGVYVREPDLVMRGTRADVDLNRETAIVRDADFLLPAPELRGTADAVARDEAGNVVLTRQEFTRCEPGNNSWRVGARRVRLPEEAVFGTAHHAVVRIMGVPVLYTPYIKFPVTNDRQSGFLFPNIEFSGEDGLDFSAPYYLNLAPNRDATLVPRIVGKRGYGLGGEYRHLSRWEQTTLAGFYLPNDDLYNGTLKRDDWENRLLVGAVAPPTFNPADRWLVDIDHRGQIGRFSSHISYSEASDPDYFRDLGSDLGESSRIALQQWGQIAYHSGGLFVRLWGQAFQRLDDIERNEYRRLPELEILYTAPGPGPIEYGIWANGASFDRDTEGLRGGNALTGERVHLEPRLTLPLRWPFGFLKATAAYRHTEYRLQSAAEPLADHRPSRGMVTAAVDGGLVFERELNWFNRPLVQTLEPRLYYLYQGYENQDHLPLFDAKALTASYLQLFRENRFSGLDRIGDANHLSVGLTTRLFGRDDGRELFRAGIGQIVHFSDRRVTLTGRRMPDERHGTSAIAGEFAGRFAERWRLVGSLVWDPNDNQVDEAAGMLQYRMDNRRVINLGYRNRLPQDIDQTDVSLYWPVSRRFALYGRWNYDVVSGRTIEGIAGIEYNDCCWQIRVLVRRFLDQPAARGFENVDADSGIFLQIILKGLAGFGGRMESLLERGIRGYDAQVRQSG